jgi:hypothetical protein
MISYWLWGVVPVSMRKCLRVEVGRALARNSSLVTSAERRGSSWGDLVRRGKEGGRWEQLLINYCVEIVSPLGLECQVPIWIGQGLT